MIAPGESTSTARPRIVLLGASNLTRGISSAVGTARLLFDDPCEYLIAMGHGRSYGQRSRVLGRSLPGIVECGLWDVLRRHEAPQTVALITDIGNDVMYGVPVPTIAQWVTTCLDRLWQAEARIVMTLLPLAGIEGFAPWRYRVAKTILFPSSPMSLPAVVSATTHLNDLLREMAQTRGVELVEHPRQWYGLDRIHIRRRHLSAAYAQVMRRWSVDRPDAPPAGRSLRRWLALRLATPQRWWLLGRERGREQPACRLPGGSTVSLY